MTRHDAPPVRTVAPARWLMLVATLLGSAAVVGCAYAARPEWLGVLAGGYLVFGSAGLVAVLCIGPRLAPLPGALLVAIGSLATTIVLAVLLDLAAISVCGRSVAGAELIVELLGVGATVLWRRTHGSSDFWSHRVELPTGRWSRPPSAMRAAAVTSVALAVLLAALIVSARSQHPQGGVAYSSFGLIAGDPALDGELTVAPRQSVVLGLELDTQGDVRTATASAMMADRAGPSTPLTATAPGRFTGRLTLVAPAQRGRFEVTISTPNPTHVAEPPISNPATVTGASAEEVNSALRLEVTIWLTVT